MPLGSGFTGVIPAIEFLLDQSEGAPIDLSMWRLLIWSIGLGLFGVIFAVPLRRQVIVKEKLKFPTGTATAVLIAVLHGIPRDKPTRETTDHDEDETHESLLNDDCNMASASSAEIFPTASTTVLTEARVSEKFVRLLSQSFGASALYTLAVYFVPQIRDLPIFGLEVARDWLWTLNPSPAYVGQGIIMGPGTMVPMLFGALVGWGILSPLAKSRGWAPGQTNDWEEGSRGWIAWVALVIMLTDTLINLGWFLCKPLLRTLGCQSTPTGSIFSFHSLGWPRFKRHVYAAVPRKEPNTLRSTSSAVIDSDDVTSG